MTFQDAVKSGYLNYATFSGRAARPAFWWWFLFQIIVSVILATVFGAGHMVASDGGGMSYQGGLLANLWSLANFIPGIAVGIRRLHDLDKSGWWTLIVLIPLVGWIILIVWYCTKGTVGPNRFGPQTA